MSVGFVDIGCLITGGGAGIGDERPTIAGTRTSVRRVVALYKQGYSPDDIVSDKDYLTLAQVHAALAYYYANHEAVEQDLADEDAEYDRLASAMSSRCE